MLVNYFQKKFLECTPSFFPKKTFFPELQSLIIENDFTTGGYKFYYHFGLSLLLDSR